MFSITQNRDAIAIHLKLDELIKGVPSARNHMVNLENMTDEELTALQEEFTRLRRKHEKVIGKESNPAAADQAR